MVPREHSLFNLGIGLILWLFLLSCSSGLGKKEEGIDLPSLDVDTTAIPRDTLVSTTEGLRLTNGIYYWQEQPYSGYLTEQYETGQTKLVYGYLNGMQHGKSVSYYESGQLRDNRMYKQNKSFGRHYGYWENGKMKFDYLYLNDKREGGNKQWYESGNPYSFLNFKDDREEGMQQAWRENGKLYINYEAKDGFRYGLQKSGLCATLENEKFKPYSP